jgi:predicted Zn-dependent protease
MRYSLVLLSLLLTACAGGATSRTPTVSRDELAMEQREQETLVRNEQAKKTSAEGAAMTREQMLARLREVGERVIPAGQRICQELHGAGANCNFPIALDKDSSNDVNAYTNGKKLVVSPAMMRFADKEELAVVIAHEYAHAIMGHPGKTQQNATVGGLIGMAADMLAQSQGINTGGALGKLGVQSAVLRYSQGFEREADYIGIYVLARAGYPTAEAKKLWRRMATVNPQGIYNSSTHPTTAERYLLLDKTAQEIKAKKEAGAPLLPERLPEEK